VSFANHGNRVRRGNAALGCGEETKHDAIRNYLRR
jgi:hypothetical protein